MCMCASVCVRKSKMIDDKGKSKGGSWEFLFTSIKLRECRESRFILSEKNLFSFEN